MKFLPHARLYHVQIQNYADIFPKLAYAYECRAKPAKNLPMALRNEI